MQYPLSTLSRGLAAALLGLATVGASAAPMAATSFTYYRGGSPVTWAAGLNIALHDSFEENGPLQGPAFTGTSTLAGYLLGGATLADVSESGGLLFMDPAQAQVSNNAAGQPGHSMRLQLQTSTTDPARGLSRSAAFGVALEVSANHLPAAGQAIGLRLGDGFSNSNDFVDLSLSGSAGGLLLTLRSQDFQAGTVTPLMASVPVVVPQGAATVVLGFLHPTADSSTLQASWAFLDAANGFVGGPPTLGPTFDLFHGEQHTLAYLRATQAVPEPGAWALLAAGGALLALRRRRAD